MDSATMKDISDISRDFGPRLFVTNRKRWNRAVERIAAVGFFLFFPGFLMYHVLIAATPLGPFIGGLFGYSSVLFAILLPIFSLPVIKNYISIRPIYLGLFFLFIFYVLLWTGIHWLFAGNDGMAAVSMQSIRTVVIWIAMFYVGMLLPRMSFCFNAIFSFLFFFMLAALVLYVTVAGEGMFYAKQFFNGDDIASYQVFARSALAIIIVVLVGRQTLAARSVIIAGGLVILFILGARSELVGFLLLSIALMALFTLKDPRFFLYCIIGLLGFTMSLLIFEVEIQSRQAELMDLASSSSWQARMHLQDIAIQQIAQSPIIGAFGGHFLESGRLSAYSHNVLSAWVNYGAMGFLLYIMLTFIPTIVSVYYIVNRSYSDDWLLCFCFNFVSLVLIMGAKSVFWPLPALGWGLYIRAWMRYRASGSV